MLQVMNGQGHTRAPGVQEPLAPEGGTDRRDVFPVGDPSAGVLATLADSTAVRSRELEVVITPDLVADLYDPTLVISHAYVGPERRRTDRSAPSAGVPSWVRKVVSVLLLTAAVVVPLTMIAARSVPPAVSGPPSAPATGTPTPKASPGGARHGTHVFGATSQQIARAQAAYQRALARVGAAGGLAADPPSAGASAASGATAATPATASSAPPPSVAPRAAAAAAAAQARADAQAAASARRQARAAARAQARAERAAAKGTSGTGTTGDPAAGA